MTTYHVIRYKETGHITGPRGVSTAPHLYRTQGIAQGLVKQKRSPEAYEVVPVELTIPGATFVERLQQEYDQLTDRLAKLRAFLKTDAYLNLLDIERNDLVHQEALMTNLASLLDRRLTRAQLKAAA